MTNQKCENCIHFDMCAELIAHYHKVEKGMVIPFMCDEDNEKLNCDHYKDKSLIVELPCAIGETVYHITNCKDFSHELDGTLYDSNGGYGTATGYYCPCELRDNCPFDEEDFDCEKQKDKLAIFEDEVKGFVIDEYYTVILLDYSRNVYISDFGKTVFTNKEDAEAKLKEVEGK